jgi:hypothetical protein
MHISARGHTICALNVLQLVQWSTFRSGQQRRISLEFEYVDVFEVKLEIIRKKMDTRSRCISVMIIDKSCETVLFSLYTIVTLNS